MTQDRNIAMPKVPKVSDILNASAITADIALVFTSDAHTWKPRWHEAPNTASSIREDTPHVEYKYKSRSSNDGYLIAVQNGNERDHRLMLTSTLAQLSSGRAELDKASRDELNKGSHDKLDEASRDIRKEILVQLRTKLDEVQYKLVYLK